MSKELLFKMCQEVKQPPIRACELVIQLARSQDMDKAFSKNPLILDAVRAWQPWFEKLTGYECDGPTAWLHHLGAAVGAGLVASRILGLPNAPLAFAAGLLHDVGKYALSENLPKSNQSQPISEGKTFLDWEKAQVNYSHPEAGAMLAKEWGLSDDLVMLIQHHHQPTEAPLELRPLALAVHLGDIFAMMTGIDTPRDNMAYPLDPIADQYIKRDARWEMVVYPKLLLDIDSDLRRLNGVCEGQGGTRV